MGRAGLLSTTAEPGGSRSGWAGRGDDRERVQADQEALHDDVGGDVALAGKALVECGAGAAARAGARGRGRRKRGSGERRWIDRRTRVLVIPTNDAAEPQALRTAGLR